MSQAAAVAHGHEPASGHHEPQGILKYLWFTDHKVIAQLYLWTGMFMALIGGLMAYVSRMQLAFPGKPVPGFGVVSPVEYNALVTNHGTIMIFWVAMPVLIAAFGNFLIPLMIGADDMVFPRINRLSYQVFLLSAIVILASLVSNDECLLRIGGGMYLGRALSKPLLFAVDMPSILPYHRAPYRTGGR